MPLKDRAARNFTFAGDGKDVEENVLYVHPRGCHGGAFQLQEPLQRDSVTVALSKPRRAEAIDLDHFFPAEDATMSQP